MSQIIYKVEMAIEGGCYLQVFFTWKPEPFEVIQACNPKPRQGSRVWQDIMAKQYYVIPVILHKRLD